MFHYLFPCNPSLQSLVLRIYLANKFHYTVLVFNSQAETKYGVFFYSSKFISRCLAVKTST